MKILITGCCGFIGYHLTRKLLSNDCFVVGVDNLNPYYDISLKLSRLENLTSKNFIFNKCDISLNSDLKALYEDSFDVVIHLAAQAGVRYSISNPIDYFNSNLLGFYNILDLMRSGVSKKLIYASSSSVYGFNDIVPFSEDANLRAPVSFYAATKLSNEHMAYSFSNIYGFASIGLRFFTVYGPWGRPDMSPWLFSNAILEEKPINIYNHGKMSRDFTFIDDIVEGIIGSISFQVEDDKNGVKSPVFNLGNQSPVELMYFVKTLENKLGKIAKKNFLPMQPGDVLQTFASTIQAKEAFGYDPKTSIEDGLSEWSEWFLEWHKKNS